MTDLYKRDHDKYMLMATVPLIICGTVLYSARVLLLCAVAVLTAKAVDVAVSMLRRQDYDTTDHSSELSAVIFCLMLPVSVPVYVVAVSVLMAVLVGKHLFGGKDVYPFNLAALAMCTAAVNWSDKVFAAVVPFSKVAFWSGNTAGITTTTAGIVKSGGVPTYGTMNLLLGNHPGAMGSDFVLVIVAIGVYLIVTKKISWRIPISYLSTCVIIAFLFPRIYDFPRIASMELELLNGVVLFTALFMLNEPATTPKGKNAQIIYGITAGVLGMIFRYMGGFELGTCFALLLVNTLDGVIERFADSDFFSRNSKRVMALASGVVSKRTGGENGKKEISEPKKKNTQPKAAQPKTKKNTMGIISEAEDSIDGVTYSTRTISIEEVLKEEAKQNKKGGK